MIMSRQDRGELVLLSPLKIRKGVNGSVVITRKFLEGVLKYVEKWPGPVAVLAEIKPTTHGNLDDQEVKLSDLPFQIRGVTWEDPNIAESFQNASVVVCSLDDWQQIPVASRCAALDIPCVCITEYTLRTRRQIICAETMNPLLRLRRIGWAMAMERRRRRAVAVASGIQCNGTPTYVNYHPLNENALLFFDSRIEQGMLVSPEMLAERTSRLIQGGPLRLAFSGRLIAMKGANHLPRVAAELRRLGVPFTLDLFGDGVLVPKIKSQIEALNLGSVVRLRGVLDFALELMPTISAEIDLFVCCHPQGDPSCTYLETMACGVPIAGYDNEAFHGVVESSGLGWTSPMNDPQALARVIARLNQDRHVLAKAAAEVREFAAQHTFDRVFLARIEHLLSCADR